MPLLSSLKVSVNMAENIILKRAGASTQPCLTPLLTRIGSGDSPSSCTQTCIPSWNESTRAINLCGQPNCAIIFHKPSLLTVSKALVMSTKLCRNRDAALGISPGVDEL